MEPPRLLHLTHKENAGHGFTNEGAFALLRVPKSWVFELLLKTEVMKHCIFMLWHGHCLSSRPADGMA